MAKGKHNAKKKKPQQQAESYQHKEADSLLRPDIGTQAQFKKRKPPVTYQYDSSLSPTLVWAGKAERLAFDVPTLPLFVHERLSTEAIIQTLRGHRKGGVVQASLFDLFADPQRSIADQVLKAYEYRCAKCGQPYDRKAMSLVGVKADHHFVRCTCDRCNVEAVAVVIVKEVVVRHVVDDPVMTEDDVMDAADILRRSPALTTVSP